MHTGYDNFWMYQTIRHEPVLSLSKSDSYSHAVLTDSYKPLPNGGCSGHLSNYLIPQNNVASSLQSDQSRMTSSQCVWPSSVYSLSFRSSYANNFQSPETYSSQSASLNSSTQKSQVQQNYNSRHLKNTNFNFPQVFANTNKNNSNYSNSIQTQSSKNNDTPVSKIRVKDVFSLNNGILHNSLLENNLLQTYQNKQPECAPSYATVNSFTSYDSKTPAEYMDYAKINLFESDHLGPPYAHARTEQTNHQKFLQHSDLFYQQNKQLSNEYQFPFSDNKEMEKNLPQKAFNTNSLIRQLSNPKKNWEAEVQNIQRNSCNVLYKNKRIKVQPKRNSSELSNLQNSETVCSSISKEKTNNIHYSGSLKASKRIMHDIPKINGDACSQSHFQENLPKTDDTSSTQVSLTGELRKCRKKTEPLSPNPQCSSDHIKEQENNFIKITIPHTGQSSFIPINDSNCVEKNPNPSLSCLLESESQLLYQILNKKSPDHNHREPEKNGNQSLPLGQINQDSSISNKVAALSTNSECSNSDLTQNNHNAEIEEFDRTFHLNLTSSPKKLKSSNENLLLKEHVDLDCQKNCVFHNSTGSSDNISENVDQKIFEEEESKSTKMLTSQSDVSKALILKQENFYSKVENSGEEFLPGDGIFPQIIKIEANFEDFSVHEHKSESSTSENHLLDVDDAENIDFNEDNVENDFSTKKPELELKIITNALKNVENRIQESDISVDNSDKEETVFSAKNKMENFKTERKKFLQPGKNYKSKINKEKLDLLIQFLNKDDETVEMNTSEETELCLKKTSFTNKREKEVHLSRNRRKLSKTCIVKNKNNSREMISLISHKVARMDTFNCSYEAPEIIQNIKNVDKSGERSEEDSSVIEKNINFSENYDKINNHSQENQIRKEDCLKSEFEVNVFECKKKQDMSEKPLSGKENCIEEKDNINNTIQTFQNLKAHFCISCNLMSSVDSFWINVISGELRCLNCFKKMIIRAEEHILKSKSGKADGKIYSESNLVQKDEVKQVGRNRKENKQKPGFEKDLENCNGLISVTEFECNHQKAIDLKENIKQEPMKILNESSIKNRGEVNFTSEYCAVNAVNFTNTSRRQSVCQENKASILGKTVEEQNKLKIEDSLKKCVKTVKWKDVAHKSKVLENDPKQEISELYKKSKRKNITENNEISADETENSGGKALPLNSKQMCSTLKTFQLNRTNKERKNMLKEKNITKLLKNYKEEKKFSDQAVSKSNFTESSITAQTQVLKKHTEPELTDKTEKLSRKNTSKEEYISEAKIERKKSTDSPNQNRKKTISKEEFPSGKLQISKHSKKEIRVTDLLNESVAKTYSKDSCHSQKTHILKRNTKHESLDKLKRQNASKEICSDQKPPRKVKEADIAEKSKRKNLSAQNCTEKYKKVEWTDLSKKRKNVEEGFVAHKVRIVEEHATKEKKLMTHSSDGSKEKSVCHKNKTLEHEKQSAKDSEGKLEKKSSSKELFFLSSGNSVREKANQTSDPSEKSKTKGDLSYQKAKTSEHLKHRRDSSSEMSRRKSKDECISPKPAITKEHSKNETKTLMESYDNLRRNSISKDDSRSVSKHFSNESSLTENKERKKAEEKEKKHYSGKRPKKSRASSDMNISEILGSPLIYEWKKTPNKKQHAMITKEFPSSKKELLKSEGNSNKEKGKTEIITNEKEAFQKHSDMKNKRELENDLSERNGQKSQMQCWDDENLKGKVVECPSEEKAGGLQPGGGGREKTVLLTKLIKKTKKLSWTLLNVAP